MRKLIFILALANVPWTAFSGCPFASRSKRSFESEADILEVLKERFNQSLYSKGLDLETRIRDDPTKKNLFGKSNYLPTQQVLIRNRRQVHAQAKAVDPTIRTGQ